MQRKAEKVLLVAATGIALVMGSVPVHSESIEISGRNIQHITNFEPTEVAEGQLLVTIEADGVTLHPDGEVSTNHMWAQIEQIGGISRDRGYFERTWPDGSTTVERFEGEGTTDVEGVAGTFDGRFEYIRGTGYFEGIVGTGTYTGTAYDNGMLVADWQATLELPVE